MLLGTNILRRTFAAQAKVATHTRVAIVGGGPAGNSVSSQLISSGRFKAEDITVIDPEQMHHYQPGYTNIAGGVWNAAQEEAGLMRDRGECLNKNLNWLKQRVTKLDPDNNTIYVDDNESPVTYDYLVMASGVELRYDLIEGSLDALNDADCPVGSMYRLDFAHKMSDLRCGFKRGKAIFTLPTMPVKCGGAPQKIMYLSEETWRNNGVRSDIDMHWYTSAGGMFPVKKYGDALKPLAEGKGIDLHFQHLIKKVDGANRTVTFENTATKEMVETDFDLLHVVPPNTTHKFVRESPLTTTGNFIDVDQNTLQHKTYDNVFALGDNCSAPTAKTAAAVFSQSPIVVNNLIKHAEGKALNAKYEGYSSCPLFVGDKKLMLMEFKYGDQPNETFSNNQQKPNWPFYMLKKHAFPSAYWNYMPQGKWYGRDMLRKPTFD